MPRQHVKEEAGPRPITRRKYLLKMEDGLMSGAETKRLTGPGSQTSFKC